MKGAAASLAAIVQNVARFQSVVLLCISFKQERSGSVSVA